MKILTIVGARPQFIKVAPLSRALKLAGIEEILVHTGQHYDYEMSKIFFDELDISPPKFNLELGGGLHGQMTGQMLEKLETVLIEENPTAIIVYGDTNSTLAGALAASKLHIPVVHIEAGLRSYNRRMPEEINRILTDHVSSLLVCSSEEGVSQLAKEGIRKNVYDLGDLMYDASLMAAEVINNSTKEFIPVEMLGVTEQKFALATFHRQENTDDSKALTRLLKSLKDVALPVVLPAHPRLLNKVKEHGVEFSENVFLIEPVGYLTMNALLQKACLVLTDSGGLQKEAYWAKVPCLTLRTETEWVETVESGWNIIVNGKYEILNDWESLLSKRDDWKPLYGNGSSAKKIVKVLTEAINSGL